MAHRSRTGVSACLMDIGVHAHNLALFVTGLELDAVSAGLTTLVPDAGWTTTPVRCCASSAARAACRRRAKSRSATSTI
jgi:predicted dehydrogenase